MNAYQKHFTALPLLVILLTVISCTTGKHTGNKTADGYELIFDGKTLDGWIYDPVYWRVENGILTGEVTPSTLLHRNSFIIKKDLVLSDFELKVEYRISADGNSGVNYRSEIIDSLLYAMRGYQADIDGRNNYTGQNYEERKRTTLAYRGQKVVIDKSGDIAPLQDNIKNNAWTKTKTLNNIGSDSTLLPTIHNGDWNEYHLIIKGNRLLHYINGVLMSDVTDNDPLYKKSSGSIGVQVHVGPPMKIEYRNFRIKRL